MVSVFGAIYVAVRLFAISGGSFETSMIVLQTQGTATVILSAILGFVPTVPMFAVAGLILWRNLTADGLTQGDMFPLVGALIVALVISPPLIFIGIVLIGAPYLLARLALVFFGPRFARLEGMRRSLGEVRIHGPLDPGTSVYAMTSPSEDPEFQADMKVLSGISAEVGDELVPALETNDLDAAEKVFVRVPVLRKRLRSVKHADLSNVRAGLDSNLKRIREIAGKATLESRLRSFSVRVMIPGWSLAFVLTSAVLDGPWLPLERIESPDGNVVGYVLESDDDDNVTLLRDQPRRVFRIKNVHERTYCISPDWEIPEPFQSAALRPLLLPTESADYPKCE